MILSFIQDDKFLKKDNFEKFLKETKENLVITDTTYECFIDNSNENIFGIFNKNQYLISVIWKRYNYSSVCGNRFYDELLYFIKDPISFINLGTIHLRSINIKYNFQPNIWFETKDVTATGILSKMKSCKYVIQEKGKISIKINNDIFN